MKSVQEKTPLSSGWINPNTYLNFINGSFKQFFLNQEPFPHLIVDNFLQPDIYQDLLRECQRTSKEPNGSRYGLSYGCKMNWSYFPNISFLRFFLKGLFRDLLEQVIEEPILPKPGGVPQIAEFLPGSKGFECHSDSGEPFDFVTLLYLTDDSHPPLGGQFCLHDCEGNVVKRFNPLPNRLICFKISRYSYHSVSEISLKGGKRMNLTVDWVLPESDRARSRKGGGGS